MNDRNILEFPSALVLTEIVRQARKWSVIDLGQLTTSERRELDAAVEHRLLVKGMGGPYIDLKTVWAIPGYKFAAERSAEIALMRYLTSAVRKAA